MVSAQKHILVVAKYYPPFRGGIEQYTLDLVNAVEPNYAVTVIVHNHNAKDEIERHGNVTIIRCGTPWIVKSQPISPSMWWHLSRAKADLVHFSAPNFWAAALLNFVGPRCPLVITHHCDVYGRPLLRRVVMPFYRRLVRRSAAVVVTSAKNVAVSQDLPPGIPRVEVIPCGVDHRKFLQADADVGRSPAGAVVGFVGRFVRYKGLPVLISALAMLKDVQAVLIGGGELKGALERQIAELGLASRVRILDGADDARKIVEMRNMDIVVLPSIETTEAFGIVQVEAQLLAKPMIASDLATGVTDVTVNDVTGLLVPPGDAHALAGAIDRLIRDEVLRKRFGEAGRQRALSSYTLDIFGDNFRRLFGELLQ